MGNSEHIQSEESRVDDGEIMLSQSKPGEAQRAKFELEDVVATLLLDKSLGLSHTNDDEAIRAIIEERKERQGDKMKRSKMRSKNMKKKRKEKLGESFPFK